MVTFRMLEVDHSDSSSTDDSHVYDDVNEAAYVPTGSKQ